MSKRGGVELFILLVVILIGIVGLYFTIKCPGRATGYNYECNVICTPVKNVEPKLLVTSSSEEAQSMCRTYAENQCKPGVPARAIARAITGYTTGDPLYYYTYPGSEDPILACQRACQTYQNSNPKCLANCQQYSPIGDPYAWRPDDWRVTGEFAVPSAKGYGGEIRGVSEESARAFGGRAYEIPSSCFKCSCGGVYTTPYQEAAANACANLCGGIVTEVGC